LGNMGPWSISVELSDLVFLECFGARFLLRRGLCGVAGAIAAGFGTPMAAIVFSHEVVLR